MQNAIIIDKDGYIVEYVQAEHIANENGENTDNILGYTLKDGEKVIYDTQKAQSMYRPQWDGENWVETGSAPEPDIEAVRAAKLTEMAKVCDETIYAGTDAPTSKGMEHFSLTIPDQKNILAQTGVAGTGKSVLYHADGKPCRLFEPEEFRTVSEVAFAYITYCTTLCNFYNTWIRRSEEIGEIKSIVWGSPLPDGLVNEDGYTLNELMEIMGIPFRAPAKEADSI